MVHAVLLALYSVGYFRKVRGYHCCHAVVFMDAHYNRVVSCDVGVYFILLRRVFDILPCKFELLCDFLLALVCSVGANYPFVALWYDFEFYAQKCRVVLAQIRYARLLLACFKV